MAVAAANLSACLSSSRPLPVTALVRTIGASARQVPVTMSRTSSSTRSSQSSSTRSHFVSAMTPHGNRRSFRISRCSRVCCLMESSAATTSKTASIPVAPASIFRTKRSWPGTSTTPKRCGGTSKWAKPSSIVMPRFCSSGSRSVSTPVNARISEVFPWSMWPAVPRMRSLDSIRSF